MFVIGKDISLVDSVIIEKQGIPFEVFGIPAIFRRSHMEQHCEILHDFETLFHHETPLPGDNVLAPAQITG